MTGRELYQTWIDANWEEDCEVGERFEQLEEMDQRVWERMAELVGQRQADTSTGKHSDDK